MSTTHQPTPRKPRACTVCGHKTTDLKVIVSEQAMPAHIIEEAHRVGIVVPSQWACTDAQACVRRITYSRNGFQS